ncbi:peroxisome biogenesis protein 19-2-like protein [Carex littledalei]|uniref:Peroxisome biogenesis protein 19-2-like protein n=1 Tax=Carex littledalei TaxID=544730 RepID=A0A833VNV8_9POAL|nr:peroxisome biogenesis protein 19-2-like protein [Carex littledalei]
MAGGDPSDDLDQLLDSALDDFNKLDLSSRSTSSQPSSSRAKKVSSGMNNSPSGPTGLGMGLPDPRAKRKGKQRAPQPMPRGSVNYAFEALEKLTQQTRDGLETVTAAGGGASVGPRGGEMGLNEEAMVEEFVKQFEDLAGSQSKFSIRSFYTETIHLAG